MWIESAVERVSAKGTPFCFPIYLAISSKIIIKTVLGWKATFRYWDIQDQEKANSKQKPALSPEKAAIYEELTYTPSPLSLQKK